MGMPYYVGYGWLFSNWLCHDCVSSVCSPCQCPVSYSRNQSKSIRLTSAPPPGIKYGFIEFKMSKNTNDNNTNDNNNNDNDSTSDDDTNNIYIYIYIVCTHSTVFGQPLEADRDGQTVIIYYY